MIDKLSHYSITSAPSVIDEEALTALELVGRIAQKVNECIDVVNKLDETVGSEVHSYVDKTLHDAVTKEVAKVNADLEERVDQIITETGNTTPEVADARLSTLKGEATDTLGEAVRDREHDLHGVLGHLKTVNLFRPTFAINKRGISSSTGELTETSSQWVTNFMPCQVGRIYLASSNAYKVVLYDNSKNFHGVINYGAKTTCNGFMRFVFTETDLPYADRWKLAISEYGQRGLDKLVPFGIDTSSMLTLKQIEGRALSIDDVVIAGLTEKTRPDGTTYLCTTLGEVRIVTPFPVYIMAGAKLTTRGSARIFKCDSNRENPTLLANGTIEYTFTESAFYMFSIARLTDSSLIDNTPLTETTAEELANSTRIVWEIKPSTEEGEIPVRFLNSTEASRRTAAPAHTLRLPRLRGPCRLFPGWICPFS